MWQVLFWALGIRLNVINQGLLTSALLAFGAKEFFVVRAALCTMGTKQHPWPLPVRCQLDILPVWQPNMPPHIIRCPWGRGTKLSWELPNSQYYHFKVHIPFNFSLRQRIYRYIREEIIVCADDPSLDLVPQCLFYPCCCLCPMGHFPERWRDVLSGLLTYCPGDNITP